MIKRISTALLLGVILGGIGVAGGIAIGSGRGLSGTFDGFGYLFGASGVIVVPLATIALLAARFYLDREGPGGSRTREPRKWPGTTAVIATIVIGLGFIATVGGGVMVALMVLSLGLPVLLVRIPGKPRRDRKSRRSLSKWLQDQLQKLIGWLDERPREGDLIEDEARATEPTPTSSSSPEEPETVDAEIVDEPKTMPAPKPADPRKRAK